MPSYEQTLLAHNPLHKNPLQTRHDLQQAARDLCTPILPALREGGARPSLGVSAAHYSKVAEAVETVARPLFALAPLAAGGGDFAHWDLFRHALCQGTAVQSPQYWGPAPAHDHRLVEMGAIGLGMALAPEQLWQPLPASAQSQLLDWLNQINQVALYANNWQFFRVLVNLGFQRVGAKVASAAVLESLAIIDSLYLQDGWYCDGGTRQVCDHYVGWAYHYYGLIYAVLAAEHDPERCARFRARARRFAQDYCHWFDAQGGVVPYGRSLSYRFAAAGFWAALAYADEEALPWPVIKGLYLRHLQWWARRPIARTDGVLSLGYGYENLLISEFYNSPSSPYWAMKAFLALAVPQTHPFWRAAPAPLPQTNAVSAQVPASLVVSSDATQVQALVGGQGHAWVRQCGAKYGKFAYSSVFGFSLDADSLPFCDRTDSTLLLREPGEPLRQRTSVEETAVEQDMVYSRWQPLRGVSVDTVLWGSCPWHVRVHRLRTDRALEIIESGFSLGIDGLTAGELSEKQHGNGVAWARSGAGLSCLFELQGNREAAIVPLAPNMNIMWPRAVLPVLRGTLAPGEHWLACAVLATDDQTGIPSNLLQQGCDPPLPLAGEGRGEGPPDGQRATGRLALVLRTPSESFDNALTAARALVRRRAAP